MSQQVIDWIKSRSLMAIEAEAKTIEAYEQLNEAHTTNVHYLKIRHAKRKQKFWTYTHNLNLEYATKYHKKINCIDTEMLSKVQDHSEADEEFGIVSVKNIPDTKAYGIVKMSTKENGILAFSEEIKIWYDRREEMLERVKQCVT